MNRWRRPLILIALLLLAGSVVNVAVAWAIVCRMGHLSSEEGSGAPPGFHLPPDMLTDGHQFRRSLWRSTRWRPVKFAPGGWWLVSETHVYDAQSTSNYDAQGALMGIHVRYHPEVSRGTTAAGWPFLALRVSYNIGAFGQRTAISGRAGGVAAPNRLVNGATRRAAGRRLPLDPLALGFLINTLFYTAILALPLSFFPIRRRLRARRGRCPKCGYDLAGLAAPCPECGATR